MKDFFKKIIRLNFMHTLIFRIATALLVLILLSVFIYAEVVVKGNDFHVSGNVGIGTTSPVTKLHVDGGNIRFWNDVEGLDIFHTYSDGSHTFRSLYEGSNADFHFQTKRGALEPLTIKGNGRVGIGVITPSEKLEVNGNVKATGTICDSNGCIGSGAGGSLWNQNGNNIFYNSGNVGIGNTNPEATLHVNRVGTDGMETIRVRGRYGGNPSPSGGIGVDSAATYWGTSLFHEGNKVFTVESNTARS